VTSAASSDLTQLHRELDGLRGGDGGLITRSQPISGPVGDAQNMHSVQDGLSQEVRDAKLPPAR
jgi:hypothetical protein